MFDTYVFQVWPRPGAIVSVPIFLGFHHKGIVSDRWYRGKPMVISASARTREVREEPWDTFTGGRDVTVERNPEFLEGMRIVYRARSRIGTPYDLFAFNCEHLVSYSLGRQPQSPQLAVTALVLVVGLIALGARG